MKLTQSHQVVLTLAAQHAGCRVFYEENQIRAAFLCGQGLLERRERDHAPGGFQYRITDAGRKAPEKSQ